MQQLKFYLGIAAIIAIAFLLANSILTGNEKAECRQWRNKKSIAAWQQEQCTHYHLPLTGNVRPETIR